MFPLMKQKTQTVPRRKLPGRNSLTFRQHMLPRKNRNKRLRKKPLHLKTLDRTAIPQKTRIELTLDKFLHDERGIGLMQLQIHLRIQPPISPQHLRQRRQHRRADKSHPQKAFFPSAHAARLVHILLNVPQRPPRSLQKHLSSTCKFHGTRCPQKKRIAKNLFQLADLLRKRRLHSR